jgi:hypothetical protein
VSAKAIERRPKDSVGISGAASRLIVLGQGEGGKQHVTARALMFRDGDGGLERFHGGRGVRRITLA